MDCLKNHFLQLLQRLLRHEQQRKPSPSPCLLTIDEITVQTQIRLRIFNGIKLSRKPNL